VRRRWYAYHAVYGGISVLGLSPWNQCVSAPPDTPPVMSASSRSQEAAPGAHGRMHTFSRPPSGGVEGERHDILDLEDSRTGRHYYLQFVRIFAAADSTMPLYNPRVQALVLLGVFLAGGIFSPLAHRISHHSHAHHQPASGHERALGLHLGVPSDTFEETCQQCLWHQSAPSGKHPVVPAGVTAESTVSARQGIRLQCTASGQQARAPPARLS